MQKTLKTAIILYSKTDISLQCQSVHLVFLFASNYIFWSINMGKNNNYSQQFDSEEQDLDEWNDKDDLEDDLVHNRKDHQDHRGQGKGKGKVRRNIEDLKEEMELKALLGDDIYD